MCMYCGLMDRFNSSVIMYNMFSSTQPEDDEIYDIPEEMRQGHEEIPPPPPPEDPPDDEDWEEENYYVECES